MSAEPDPEVPSGEDLLQRAEIKQAYLEGGRA